MGFIICKLGIPLVRVRSRFFFIDFSLCKTIDHFHLDFHYQHQIDLFLHHFVEFVAYFYKVQNQETFFFPVPCWCMLFGADSYASSLRKEKFCRIFEALFHAIISCLQLYGHGFYRQQWQFNVLNF